MSAMNEVLNILAKIIDTVRFKLIEIQEVKNLEHRSLSRITKFNIRKCKLSTVEHVYSTVSSSMKNTSPGEYFLLMARYLVNCPITINQSFGSGSALIWLSWFRIRIGNAEPYPGQ
jgi:hypothetical protein